MISDGDDAKKRKSAVKRGQSLFNNATFIGKDEAMIELVNRMRNDAVKDIVVADELICREACLRLNALGRKEDQKHDNIYRVSQTARTLGCIVMLARQRKPNVNLSCHIHPNQFDKVVEIAKKMSTEKEKPALNVGRTVGILLSKVIMSKYCAALAALQVRDQQSQQDATEQVSHIYSDSCWFVFIRVDVLGK